MFKKIISFIKNTLPTIIFVGILLAGLSYAKDWQGPTAQPPGNNVAAPINIGAEGQFKTGKLAVATTHLDSSYGLTIGDFGGNNLGLKVAGNVYLDKAMAYLLDNNNNFKLNQALLPFEMGDITSDWASPLVTWDATYYDVSNLVPENVRKDVAFGRNQVGSMDIEGGVDALVTELIKVATLANVPIIEDRVNAKNIMGHFSDLSSIQAAIGVLESNHIPVSCGFLFVTGTMDQSGNSISSRWYGLDYQMSGNWEVYDGQAAGKGNKYFWHSGDSVELYIAVTCEDKDGDGYYEGNHDTDWIYDCDDNDADKYPGHDCGPCGSTCVTEGYECGNHLICGEWENCDDVSNYCYEGLQQCNGLTGRCEDICTATCASEGYECGIHNICGYSITCPPGCTWPEECSAGHCIDTSCEDKDGDGYGAEHCGGNDCDDNDAFRNPGVGERCDAIDWDCDEGALTQKGVDLYRTCSTNVGACIQGKEYCYFVPPSNYQWTDCDGYEPVDSPLWTEEPINGSWDINCDGLVEKHWHAYVTPLSACSVECPLSCVCPGDGELCSCTTSGEGCGSGCINYESGWEDKDTNDEAWWGSLPECGQTRHMISKSSVICFDKQCRSVEEVSVQTQQCK